MQHVGQQRQALQQQMPQTAWSSASAVLCCAFAGCARCAQALWPASSFSPAMMVSSVNIFSPCQSVLLESERRVRSASETSWPPILRAARAACASTLPSSQCTARRRQPGALTQSSSGSGIIPGIVPGIIPGIIPGIVPGIIPGIVPSYEVCVFVYCSTANRNDFCKNADLLYCRGQAHAVFHKSHCLARKPTDTTLDLSQPSGRS